jgi:hypothetical protein
MTENSYSNLPAGHSLPLAEYRLVLEISLPRILQKEILPNLMHQLRHTADTELVECRRGAFIVLETCRRIFSLYCAEVLKRKDLAEKCRRVKDTVEGQELCRAMVRDIFPEFDSYVSECATCCPSRLEGISRPRHEVAYQHALAAYGMADAFEVANRPWPEMAVKLAGSAMFWRFCSLRTPIRRNRYGTIAAQILSEAIPLGRSEGYALAA